jgi:hypothetical protein
VVARRRPLPRSRRGQREGGLRGPTMVNRRRWVIEAGQTAVEIDGTLLYERRV